MGIPYSKQINAAFDQVTPLVAEGFKVLETTKNISILLAAIQILTVILLLSIQVTLIAVLFTCNPDLANERNALVTPILKWLSDWLLDSGSRRYLAMIVFVVVLGSMLGATAALMLVQRSELEKVGETENEQQEEY